MSEEEIKAIFDSIPKVENNNCISAYGSINMDDLKNAIERLNKVPDYNDLLKENKKLKENWNKLKEYLNIYTAMFHDEVDMFQAWETFSRVLKKIKELE